MRTVRAGVQATIGYAVGRQGRALAYARLVGDGVRQVLRLDLRVPPQAPAEPAGASAAVAAVARAARELGFRCVRFVLAEPRLVEETTSGAPVAEALVAPSLDLRCVLNSLSSFSFARGATDDLTQRARAEVALNVAA